jgi:hypothetical protein
VQVHALDAWETAGENYCMRSRTLTTHTLQGNSNLSGDGAGGRARKRERENGKEAAVISIMHAEG